jgi:hypothetical protein
MSFNKRFLNEKSIRSFAKANDFKSFERYMINADAYIIDTSDGLFASILHTNFCNGNEKTRKEIHQQLINDEI